MQQIRIDLRTQQFHREELPLNWVGYGGRAYTSRWIAENVSPNCDPLGSQNDLVVSCGLLAGSGASSSYRVSIGSKSPLTGGIKESNSGGTAGFALSSLGYRGIVLSGVAAEWVVIVINEQGVTFIPADRFIGQDTFTCTKDLLSKFGNKAAVLSIGPAGENLMKAACIGITDNDGMPARHAGRGGLGAVMGSKHIKAIVIKPAKKYQHNWKDPIGLKKAVMRFSKALIDHPTTGQFLPKYGTAMILDVTQKIGGLPTRNYSQGKFEGADKINGEALFNLIMERNGKPTHACMPMCVIRCSNIIPDENGEELNRALEYETLGLLGSNCGIDDLDAICRMNRICDQLGLDTIEIGAAIGVAMEAGLLSFGDARGALGLLDEVSRATQTGQLIGNGAAITGKNLEVKRIPVVMGQSLAAYDPRVLKGTGVTYATSPMGADHTAGNVLPGMKLPDGSIPDNLGRDRQVEVSRYTQLLATMFDYLGLCWFAKPPIFEDLSLITDILNTQYAESWDRDRILNMSEKVIEMEWDYNQKAGIERNYDIPSFFRDTPLLPSQTMFDVSPDELSGIDQIHFD